MAEGWYVVKEPDSCCSIVPEAQLAALTIVEQWGPFSSEAEAIARRIGLIRSGKCQPR